MTPRKPSKATAPAWTVADGLAEELQAVEDEARRILAEHAEAVAKAFARLGPSAQEFYRLFAGLGALQFLDHDEPPSPGSRRKVSRPCRRCEAAKWLLLWAGELRLAFANAAPDAAVGYAFSIGRLQVQLGLEYADGVAYHEQQASFAHHKRGPAVDEKRRRNEQISAWNEELAFYPKGRPRERYERVREIHDRCQRTYRNLRAEAHAARDGVGETAAGVWNIGLARIDQLIPRETKRTS